MPINTPPPRPDVPRPWQPRFGMLSVLLVMVVVSVMAAAGFYLTRALQESGRAWTLTFTLFTVAAPLLLLVVVSVIYVLGHVLGQWLTRRRDR